MKILLINKYHYIKGGSETYYFGLKKMLEDNGHSVVVFSMKDEKNYPSEFEEYFVDNIDYEDTRWKRKISNAMKLIYSNQAYQRLCRLIDQTKPDIAHVNLIYHQISPSIFHALKKNNIPIVYTAHDYKIICPNYKCFNVKGLCTRCYDGKFHNCLRYKCHKDSFSKSLLVTVEAYVHKILKSYNLAEKIICPSRFMYDQLIRGGVKKDKLVVLPNFITEELYLQTPGKMKIDQDISILFYGRLSKEKGIELLIEAKKQLSAEVRLKIIGTGPEEERLKQKVKDESIANIEFLGFMQGEDLYREIRSSICTVIPSIWNEVFGLTIVESYCFGVPVIGSSIGGIKEIIKDDVTGNLFKCGNINDLAKKINGLLNKNSKEYQLMSDNCLAEKNNYDPKLYYQGIIEIYGQLIHVVPAQT